MYNFERLIFYKKARGVARVVDGVVLRFPRYEIYALGDQMRRAADSVVSNIAEGGSKKSVADMTTYLRHALGSSQKLRVQVERAFEKGYLSEGDKDKLVDELNSIGRIINGFIRRLSSL